MSSLFKICKALAALAVIAASGSAAAQEAQRPSAAAARAALLAFVQRDAEGFASAGEPWRFRFPEDHAAHPQHRADSWRFSGTLADREGRRVGFQLTLLRVGVVPPATPLSPSKWAARDAYWGELTLHDVAARRQHAFERLERSAAHLGGSERSPARVWLRDWSVAALDAQRFALSAAEGEIGIELVLRSEKPPVTRSTEAFHAYLMTRLAAGGQLRLGDRTLEIDGTAWLDRAWGEVPLPLGPVLWDRALLQLDDGRELMAVQLRRRDASAAPSATGLLIGRDGEARVLEARDLAIERQGPQWRIRVPGDKLDLEVQPYASSSGPARVAGSAYGQGYIELSANALR